MADEPTANSLAPGSRTRPGAAGDVPEHLRRRYYVDGRGGEGLGFYADAKVQTAAFRDHGKKLAAARTDPNVIRDLAAIAQHRGWSIVVAHGERDFRREAWIAGRTLGIEVRGHRPTERDLQELEKRMARRDRSAEVGERGDSVRPDDRNARASLKVVEAVVRARLNDPAAQDRILDAARRRIASWLERGVRLHTIEAGRRREPAPGRELTRGR